MPRREHNPSNDDLVKAKQRQQGARDNTPNADAGPGMPSLLSSLGNARVQRLMRAAIHRAEDGSGAVDEAVAKQIQAKRGSGQALDEGARRNLEPALGADFSDVKVHTDSEADSLNRAVQAEAFTTGNDIFFRSGKYSPGSDDGQKLLAHELTHVVQQGSGSGGGDMTVSSPEDSSEREASAVADSFNANAHSGGQPAGVARQEMPEEEEMQMSRVDRQEMPEEEEMQMSRVDRQEMPEEEEMQMSRVDRQEEEEELQMSQVDRQEEEEELQMSEIDRQEEEEEALEP